MSASQAHPLRLVLASNNAKKLAELRDLFAGVAVDLVSQGSLGVDEAEEPYFTFLENALAKARHAAAASGVAAIADDSGLCVDALGGEPGVASAHYAGLMSAPPGMDREALRHLQDAANNQRLLQELKQVPTRTAAFVCTLVAVRHAQDPEPLVAVGRWPAQILTAPAGEHGFGYDPLVWIPALGQSVAELGSAVKNQHSHRARAAAQMKQALRDAWHL